jgi:hypothetical protein
VYVPNVVETYVDLTAVYSPNATAAASSTLRNALVSRARRSPGARHNEARPAITGKTPSPIVKAPAALRPRSSMRCL